MFILLVMPAKEADPTGVGENPPTETPQVSTVVQVTMAALSVPVNIFTGTIQGILGFTNTQVQVLVDDYQIQKRRTKILPQRHHKYQR